MPSDLDLLRGRLRAREEAASRMPWAKQRPWRAETHVRWEGDLLVVDLHDLGESLARSAVADAAEAAFELETGAICFVTGQGRHSAGMGVLQEAVRQELIRIVAENGWYFRPSRPGRFVLVFDPTRAPASATGALGWGFTLLAVLFLVAAAIALLAS